MLISRLLWRVHVLPLSLSLTRSASVMAEENPFAQLFNKRQNATIATLASLAPGNGDITLSLTTADPKQATYDCISYDRSREWETVDVTVDGNTKAIPLPLHQALQAFRHENSTVTLWADLLTGDSAAERSKQASVMKEVLQNANAVNCFVAEPSGRSAEVYTILQTLANWYRQAALHAEFPKKLSLATQKNMEDMRGHLASRKLSEIRLNDNQLWQAINGVLSSSYFESVQAITDIILGSRVFIKSEAGSIAWEDLMMAYRAILFILPPQGVEIPKSVQDSFATTGGIDISLQRYNAGETLELLPMIQSAQDSSASIDPREIVFSMLPVVTPSGRVKDLGNKPEPLPSVDFNKTTEEVFTEAAMYILHERQDLLLWWKQSASCRKKLKGLPTFVPDWSQPPPKTPVLQNPKNGLREWSDSVKTPKRIFVDGDSALHVQAHALDRVEIVSPIFTENNYRQLILEQWKSAQRIPGETEEQTISKFWRAVVLDSDAGFGKNMQDTIKPSADMWLSFQSIMAEQMILDTLGCTTEQLMKDPALQARARSDPVCSDLGPATGQSGPLEELILRNSLGRRMFQTTSGRIGMTAVEKAEGDSEDQKPEGRMPNFDDAQNNPLASMMMGMFQSHLAEQNPEMAGILSQAMQGQLPGQAAPGARVGDIVVALVGGFQPYILRPAQPLGGSGELQADSKYTFVGDCHLQGVMEGECFKTTGFFWNSWKQDVPLVDILIV